VEKAAVGKGDEPRAQKVNVSCGVGGEGRKRDARLKTVELGSNCRHCRGFNSARAREESLGTWQHLSGEKPKSDSRFFEGREGV